MADIRREPQPQHHRPGIHVSDILFALFRSKWTILFCTLLGLAGAAAMFYLFPPAYQSQAKLLVRYVLERNGVDPIDNTTRPNDTARMSKTDSVIDAEVQILTSWDLAAQVAEAIGPKRLGASSNAAAAGSILGGLQVVPTKGSDVILVSYTSGDPQLARLVLQELFSRYFVKHLEVHRSAGAFDFVSQQTDQVRARLNQTEDALNTLRTKIGIVSTLQDGQKALADEATDAQKQLNAAEADLAEQQALVNQSGQKKKANSWTSRKSTSDKTPEALKALLAGKQAKVEAIKTRLHGIQQRSKQFSDLRPQIQELERKQEMDQANYKYFAASLEKARVDEALDPSKMPNISALQRPSPPARDTKWRDKISLAIAGGGIAVGIALALFRGLVLNRTIGRPLELESRLDIPLMLSIPNRSGANGQKTLPSPGSSSNSRALTTTRRNSKIAPWDSGHFIRPYCDAIRDRLGLYFELNHLTHRPKLVGVAGFSETAGASSLAAGLAASISETNDGKVLLVDVNLGPKDVHPFFKGKPAYPLKAALKPSEEMTSAADNLYLATVGSRSTEGPAQLGLKKFFDMMPNMKTSDFDYIIFDMPPLYETSPTWGMGAFMDKLLLIVEAEKNNRDLVKRGYRKLVAERNNVAVIVNKARSRIPRCLDGDS